MSDRYTIISADCHAGGQPRARTASTSTRRGATSSTRGGASTRTPSATCRTTAAPATGTTSAASATSTPTARWPRSCSRTRCRRSSRPVRSWRRRRAPRTSSDASPGSAPTTAGSPTSARSTRRSAPASLRSSSTTSTRRSKDVIWAKEHGLRGRPPAGRLARHPVDPTAVLQRVRPAVGRVPGARHARHPPLRWQRHPELPAHADHHRDLHHGDRVLRQPRPVAHHDVRRLRALPRPAADPDRTGFGVGGRRPRPHGRAARRG